MKISSAIVVLMLSAASIHAYAKENKHDHQHSEQEVREEEHVLVTVPVHRQGAQNAIPITVIDSESLRQKSSATLGDTLSSQAGLSNASFGPAVGQPVIRGHQGARVMVLQNSTSVADAASVSPDHAIASEPILAETIEVLRGPATLLYGGGAIGGVINILDERIPQEAKVLEGRAELRHASVNDEKTMVGKVSGGNASFQFYLDGLFRESNNQEIPSFAIREEEHEDHDEDEDEHEDEEQENTFGYIDNTGAKTESVTIGASSLFSRGYIGFAVNYLKSDYGIPPGAHVHVEEEEPLPGEEDEHHEDELSIDLEQTRYDLRGDWHDVNRAIEHIRWFLTYTDYQHQEIEMHDEHEEHEEPGEIELEEHEPTRFSNNTIENRLEIVHTEINGWHGAFGLQIKDRDFSAKGEEIFVPDVNGTSVGAFILEDFHSDYGVYELGVRVDSDEMKLDQIAQHNRFTGVSYSASGLWRLSDTLTFGAVVSHAERAPTVEELFSNYGKVIGEYIVHGATQTIEVGSSTLREETSRNVDVSLSYQHGYNEGFITLYHNQFNDYIYLNNGNEEQDGFSVLRYSQQDAEFSGVEMEYQHHWTWGDARVYADKIIGELSSGEDLPRLPPARVGMELIFPMRSVNLTLAALHAFNQDKPGENEEPTAAYTRWDIALEAPIFGGENNVVFVKGKNLTDEEIRYSTSFLRDIAPAAGRSIEAGVRLTF